MKRLSGLLIFILLLSGVVILSLALLISSCVSQPEVSPHFNSREIEKIKSLTLQDEFSFIVCSDIHGNDEMFTRIIDEINNLKPPPLFIVNNGDATSSGQEYQYKAFIRLISRLKIPFLCMPGNHDYFFGGAKNYSKYLGESYYYFDLDNFGFIFLDNAWGKIEDDEFNWLKNLLGGRKKIFIFMHQPPPLEEWKSHCFKGNADKFLQIATSKNGVITVFTGHIHGYSEKEYNGVKYIITGGAGGPFYHFIKGVESIHHYIIVNVKKDGTWAYKIKRVE